MAYCWRNEIALTIPVLCGLQRVLTESIAQNFVEAELLNNTEYCPIHKTQTMLKLIHSHSSVIQDCCFSMCFVLGGCLLLLVCHFCHPLSQLDQIWESEHLFTTLWHLVNFSPKMSNRWLWTSATETCLARKKLITARTMSLYHSSSQVAVFY